MTEDYRAMRDVGVGPRAMLDRDPLAPWPAVDRYPNILGAGLTLGYISSVIRLCLTGYRQQYVDLAEELLTLDPHAFSVTQKRVLAVGQGKVEFVPPDDEKLPKNIRTGIPDEGEKEIAKEMAAWVESEVDQIPDLTAAITQLAWALFYAVSALEKMLVRRDDGSIGITALNFIHYRRLSYPDPWKWDLYVWDQGFVLGPEYGILPTQGQYGLNIEPIREKFIVHAPQVCGSYPTRDGLARELVYWMAIKHIAARLGPQYLEKYAIPFVDVTYSTKGENSDAPDQPRIANDDDIALAKAFAKSAGGGANSYWAHPDSIQALFTRPEGTPVLTIEQWFSLCNSEMSKAASGGTLTTEVSHAGGNRALGQEQGKREEKLTEYDAARLGATLKRDLSDFLVENNPRYHGAPRRLWPQCIVHVNDDPDPMDEIDRGAKAASVGMPVDADALGKRVRMPLVPNPNPDRPRRLWPIMGAKMTPPPEVIGLESTLEQQNDTQAEAAKNAPQQPGKPGAPAEEKPTPPPSGKKKSGITA